MHLCCVYSPILKSKPNLPIVTLTIRQDELCNLDNIKRHTKPIRQMSVVKNKTLTACELKGCLGMAIFFMLNWFTSLKFNFLSLGV